MKGLVAFVTTCLLTAWVSLPAATAAQMIIPSFGQIPGQNGAPSLSQEPGESGTPGSNSDMGTSEGPSQGQSPRPKRAGSSDEAEYPESIADFGACIAGNGGADLLLVMDESASLSGTQSQDATDPDAVRVDAANDFIAQLAQYSQDTGAKFNVRLAGFDAGYNRYGDWMEIKDNGEAAQKEVQQFANRAEGSSTDYRFGLNGAFEDMAGSASECRAVLFFSDGIPTAADASTSQIMAEVCSENGPVARLRASGVRIFTIALSVSGQSNESPLERLRHIAEGDDCSGQPANGAMLSANDPAALFSAFRSMLPSGAAVVEDNLLMTTAFSFVLDNSVAPVQLSAQPERRIEGQLTPTLTSPSGDQVDLTADTKDIAGHKLEVRTNDALPGMVDVRLEPGGDKWAGEWKFGYRTDNKDTHYRVVMSIAPGLKLQVDGGSGEISKSSDEQLAVSLLAPDGTVRKLDGSAKLSAELVPVDGGEPKPLVNNMDISSGEAPVSLESVTERFAGNVRLWVDITTADAGDIPGTQLQPLEFEAPIAIAPSNLPKVPGKVNVTMIGEETTVEVPVSGPGKIWVEDTTFPASDGTVLAFTSKHTKDSPLELQRGEQEMLEVKVTAAKAVDATINGDIKIGTSDDVGAEAGTVNIKAMGSISAPIDAAVFGATLTIVLALAILIPLIVLYLMKYLTGRIPRRPGIHAMRVPVAVENGQLIRLDRGGAFDVDHEEIIHTPRVASSGRSVNLAGESVSVKTGWNPFDPPKVLATSQPSIADNAGQSGGRAQLPMGVHDHWLMVMDPQNKRNVSVIIAADEAITHERLGKIIADIRQNGPQRVEKLASQVAEAVSAPADNDPMQPGGFGQAQASQQPAALSGFGQPQAPQHGDFGQSPQGPQQGGFGRPPSTNGFGQPGGFGQPPSTNGFGQPDSRF